MAAESKETRSSNSGGGASGQSHHHAHHHGATERRLFIALCLTGGFMVVEAVGGLISGSLALLADAGHMLTDTAALFGAWLAMRISRRPPDAARTYGYQRTQILAAYTNGLVLVVIVIWIGIEAVNRIMNPPEILGGTMLGIAAAGLLVNLAAFWVLHSASRENLNVKSATLHVIGDILGSVAAIAAAAVIIISGWTPIDPILSVIVAALILRSAIAMLRASGHVLMEGTPDAIAPAEIKRVLQSEIDGILDVHHIHAWQITPERPMITLHVLVDPDRDHEELQGKVHDALKEHFSIDHATVQVEHEPHD